MGKAAPFFEERLTISQRSDILFHRGSLAILQRRYDSLSLRSGIPFHSGSQRMNGPGNNNSSFQE
jgi:hypothetical protein